MLAISKMQTAEKVHTDEDDEPAMVRLSDGTWATDLIEPRPLWAFDGADEKIFTGDKAGLRAAAAELIRRRQHQK